MTIESTEFTLLPTLGPTRQRYSFSAPGVFSFHASSFQVGGSGYKYHRSRYDGPTTVIRPSAQGKQKKSDVNHSIATIINTSKCLMNLSHAWTCTSCLSSFHISIFFFSLEMFNYTMCSLFNLSDGSQHNKLGSLLLYGGFYLNHVRIKIK